MGAMGGDNSMIMFFDSGDIYAIEWDNWGRITSTTFMGRMDKEG